MTEGLRLYPALERADLLGGRVEAALASWRGQVPVSEFEVAEIDPSFSDTEAFCEHYGMDVSATANTVIIEAARGENRQLAVVVVSAASRADLNGRVRKLLGVRKVSLAPRDVAVSESGQEFGSITVFGLPAAWPVIVDERVVAVPRLLMGGGRRRSKLVLPGVALRDLPSVKVVEDLARGD